MTDTTIDADRPYSDVDVFIDISRRFKFGPTHGLVKRLRVLHDLVGVQMHAKDSYHIRPFLGQFGIPLCFKSTGGFDSGYGPRYRGWCVVLECQDGKLNFEESTPAGEPKPGAALLYLHGLFKEVPIRRVDYSYRRRNGVHGYGTTADRGPAREHALEWVEARMKERGLLGGNQSH